ncbi:MAG: preprotein translocase subunit SecG [Methylococcales symbiont of Iophon sp. n. MRB-2018]|nr:MAG: preprotein translocase subunit SecG [Methylococcales symbiont of Iophon sp. n. MRB-2018]KAF3979362.1 MAG: preprotein translocase subunit SecG [Methylococcales symbiont of Iophon sp. n. MRB-2018]
MYQTIIIVHVLLGLSVVGFVLIQQGKGADAGAAFGSASSGSVFGAQGASNFLSRTTAILAALFFATSLGLAILSSYQEDEVNLMDAPEIEEVLADVPLIDSADNEPMSESLPVITEGPIIEEVSDHVETVDEEVKAEVETVVEDTETVVEDTETVVEDTETVVEDTETVVEDVKSEVETVVVPEVMMETVPEAEAVVSE